MPDLDLPVPGVTPGPEWATKNNAALNALNDVMETGRLSQQGLEDSITAAAAELNPTALSDNFIATQINNPTSQTKSSLTTSFASKSVETVVNSGRLSPSSLDTTIDGRIGVSGVPLIRRREQISRERPSQIRVVQKGSEFAWLDNITLLDDGVNYYTAFDVESLAIKSGTTYYVSDLGASSASGTQIATLTTPVNAGDTVTSLTVSAVSAAIISGQRVAILVGSDVYFFVASAAVSLGATSIPVTSSVSTIRIPAGSAVVYPRQGLRTTLDSSSSGDTIVALDRVNYRNRGTNPVDNNTIDKTVNIVGLHPETIYTSSENLTWTPTGGSTRTYQASRANVRTVIDIKRDWQGVEYTRVATQAEVDSAPGRWFQSADGSGNVYVSTLDGAAPNSSWLFALFNNTHFNFTPGSSAQTVMLKNIRIYGGYMGVRAISPSAKLTLIRKNSPILWAGYGLVGATASGLFNNLSLNGNVDHYAQDSPSFHSALDGTSYHATGGFSSRGFEERCGGHSAGTDSIPVAAGVGPTQNIGTAHSGAKVFRVSQSSYYSYGTPVADVNDGTVTENYGCDSYASLAPTTGDYNAAFAAQQSGAIMRLYRCRAWGTKYDLFSQVGATLQTVDTQSDSVGGGGTINQVNPR